MNISAMDTQEKQPAIPDEFVSPEKKLDPKYGLSWAQYTWWNAKESGIGYNHRNREEWIRNRKFAMGLEDTENYIKRAIPTEQEWITIDYSVGTPLPKSVRILINNILNHPYNPEIRMADSFIKNKQDKAKNELLGKIALRQMVTALQAQGVVPKNIMPAALKDLPDDTGDDLMYEDETSNIVEIVAMKKIITHCFETNKMSAVERAVVDDLVKLYITVIYACADENNRFTVKYIDPVQFVASYCTTPDYSDYKHLGHWEDVRVSEFRKMAATKGFSDEKILELVRQSPAHSGIFANHDERYFDLSDYHKEALEREKIRLYHFEVWQSDRMTFREKTTDSGHYFFDKKSIDYVSDSHQVHSGVVERLYHGTWVVDTDCMLKWGLKPNIVRKTKGGHMESRPQSSYIVRQPEQREMMNRSVTSEMIPFSEFATICNIKKQNFLALSIPPGTEIDVSSAAATLIGMQMDGASPRVLEDLYRATGTKYFSSLRENGDPIQHTRPVNASPSTIDGGIAFLVELENNAIRMMDEIAGLNDAVNATTPDNRRLKSVMEQSKTAFNTTIQTLVDNYLDVVREVAYRAAYHGVESISGGRELPEIKALLTTAEYESLKSVEKGEIMWDVYIRMLPDSLEVQGILNDMSLAIQRGEMDVSTSMLVRRMIRENNIQKAEVFLRNELKKTREAAMMEMQAKNEARMREIEAQARARAEEERAKTANKIEERKATHVYDLEAISLKEKERRETVMVTIEGRERLVELAQKLKIEAAAAGAGYDKDTNQMPVAVGGEPDMSVPVE